MRHFVGSQGGTARAARSARAGRRTAQRFTGFLATLTTQGVDAAAKRFHLQQYLGRSAEELLAGLVDRIAPSGAQLEDAAARSAAVTTLAELFRERGVEDNGLAALESLSPDDVRETLLAFVVNYLDERISQVLAKGLEDRPADEVRAREQDIHRFIEETVRLDLSGVDLRMDWNSTAAGRVIERILQDAYGFIESAPT